MTCSSSLITPPMTQHTATLSKSERQHRRNIISQLFESGSKTFSAFPLRAVFMPIEKDAETPYASILVSVPKRCFKRAVKRNRTKRQIREAYRLHKSILHIALDNSSQGVVLAFIWLDKELHTTEEVTHKVKILLGRIADKMKQA